jgi:CAAX prenyl protease-like protein
MTAPTTPPELAPGGRPEPGTAAYVLPFALLLGLLAVHPLLPFGARAEFILRAAVLVLAILFVSRPLLKLRFRRPLASIAVGLLVCLLWLAPDLAAPAWRSHWLFTNPLTGRLASSIPAAEHTDPVLIIFRCLQAVVLVPVAEELFWRGWLARWMHDKNFTRVPFGAFTRSTFLVSSALFALEHGPLWDVGLAAGIAYNWWSWHTRELGDCILAHASTNAALSAFVLIANRWEYWS